MFPTWSWEELQPFPTKKRGEILYPAKCKIHILSNSSPFLTVFDTLGSHEERAYHILGVSRVKHFRCSHPIIYIDEPDLEVLRFQSRIWILYNKATLILLILLNAIKKGTTVSLKLFRNLYNYNTNLSCKMASQWTLNSSKNDGSKFLTIFGLVRFIKYIYAKKVEMKVMPVESTDSTSVQV